MQNCCLLVFMLCQPLGAFSLQAVILAPLNYTAYLGQDDQEVFRCLLTGHRFVRWTINGERLSDDISTQTGIIMTARSRAGGSTESGLVIPAVPINSGGIYVQCVAISVPTDIYTTSMETGIFKVQGLLHMTESSVRSMSFNRSHNLISWRSPYTLDITDIEPDIYSYTVCTQGNVLLVECTNTSSTSILVPKYSVLVNVSVVANNIVGSSNAVTYSIPPCLTQQFGVAIPPVVSFNGSLTMVQFHIKHDSEDGVSAEVCHQLYSIIIHKQGATNVTLFESAVFGTDTLTVLHSFSLNTAYTALIQAVREGPSTTHLQVVFNNNNVQNVSVGQDGDKLSVTCHFAQGTRALGCHIEIRFLSGNTLSRNVSLTNDCNVTAIFNTSNLGNFVLSVADWEFNGKISSVVYDTQFKKFQDEVANPAYVTTSTTYNHSVLGSSNRSLNITHPEERMISTDTLTALVWGVAMILLGCVAIAILFSLIAAAVRSKTHKSKRKQGNVYDEPVYTTPSLEPTVTQNAAYSATAVCTMNPAYSATAAVCTMNSNKSYAQVLSPQQHISLPSCVYEEVPSFTLERSPRPVN